MDFLGFEKGTISHLFPFMLILQTEKMKLSLNYDVGHSCRSAEAVCREYSLSPLLQQP
jgi:hypothetical protein